MNVNDIAVPFSVNFTAEEPTNNDGTFDWMRWTSFNNFKLEQPQRKL